MKETLINNIESISSFGAIILVTIIIALITNKFFKRLIAKSTEELQNDPTNYVFLRRVIISLIYIIGFSIAIYIMPSLRALAKSLLAGAGILAVAVGFASQHALSNIISGVFIIIFKPFRINDRIRLRELNGVIEDVTLRHTVIRDFENRRIIIPNSLISGEIITNSNFGEDSICKFIEIGIGYSSDITRAKEIVREEILNHPLHVDLRTEKQIQDGEILAPVRVMRLAESAVILRGWAWTRGAKDAFQLECDLLESIKSRFDKEDIEIPFPHRTLIHKNLLSEQDDNE